MKPLFLYALLALVPVVSAANPTSDLWDLSQGTVVTAGSPQQPGFDARDIFGGSFSAFEPGNSIFADQQGLGFVHFVEWKTPTAIRLDSFDLYASGDIGAPYGSDFRDFGEFRLYARIHPANPFILVEDFIPTHPFPHGASPVVFTPSGPVFGQYFRADFVQYDKFFFGNYLGGPRIVELDGFGAAVPEPGSFALLAGLLVPGYALLRRRCRARLS